MIKAIHSIGDPLVVQWLGFCTFTAEGTGSIPSQGTKILQAMQCGGKKKSYTEYNNYLKYKYVYKKMFFLMMDLSVT